MRFSVFITVICLACTLVEAARIKDLTDVRGSRAINCVDTVLLRVSMVREIQELSIPNLVYLMP